MFVHFFLILKVLEPRLWYFFEDFEGFGASREVLGAILEDSTQKDFRKALDLVWIWGPFWSIFAKNEFFLDGVF